MDIRETSSDYEIMRNKLCRCVFIYIETKTNCTNWFKSRYFAFPFSSGYPVLNFEQDLRSDIEIGSRKEESLRIILKFLSRLFQTFFHDYTCRRVVEIETKLGKITVRQSKVKDISFCRKL